MLNITHDKLNILVAFECSGAVRDCLIELGVNAYSCDLLQGTGRYTSRHIVGNAFNFMCYDWDCIIAFPPCTYLSSAGLFRCNVLKYGTKAEIRLINQAHAIRDFFRIWYNNCNHVLIENPVGIISSTYLTHSQIVHPYYFGEPQMKRTAFWLKNLPRIMHFSQNTLFDIQTHTKKPIPISTDRKTGKNRYFTDGLYSNKILTGHNRSVTFKSVAHAIGSQISEFLFNKYPIKQRCTIDVKAW